MTVSFFRGISAQIGDAKVDLVGAGERFRHAGFSSGAIGEIEPAELYCGRESGKEKTS